MLRRSCVERVLTFLRTGLHHPVALKLQAAGSNLGHQVALESNYIKLLHNHHTTSCYLLLPGTTSVILWHFNRFNRNFDFQPLLVQDLIEALKQRRGRDMSASEIQLTAQHGCSAAAWFRTVGAGRTSRFLTRNGRILGDSLRCKKGSQISDSFWGIKPWKGCRDHQKLEQSWHAIVTAERFYHNRGTVKAPPGCFCAPQL